MSARSRSSSQTYRGITPLWTLVFIHGGDVKVVPPTLQITCSAPRWQQSVVSSSSTYAVVCWECGLKAGEPSRLNKLIRKASCVIEGHIELDKLVRIHITSHPLHDGFVKLKNTFSSRLILPKDKEGHICWQPSNFTTPNFSATAWD